MSLTSTIVGMQHIKYEMKGRQIKEVETVEEKEMNLRAEERRTRICRKSSSK
jgi:hypothetical protein